MSNITLGQLSDVAIKLSELTIAVGVLYGLLRKLLMKFEKRRLKADIVTLMALAERDILSTEQKLLLHEEYDDYIKAGGNSWAKEKFELLHKEGKI